MTEPDEELRALAAAYALDALDGEELRRFETELARSPELRAEVDGFRAVAAGLGAETPELAPPPSLKAGLFARLGATPQLPPVDAAPPAEPAGAPEPDAAPTTAPAAAPAPMPEPEAPPVDELAARRRRRRLVASLTAAASVAILVIGVVIGIGWSGPNGWGAQRELAALEAAPDAQRQTVEVSGGGEVTVLWSAELGRSAVMADGLPALGSEHDYELWYIDEAGPAPAGLVGANSWRVLEGDFVDGMVVGLTVEPAGGSEQPTTEPIAAVQT
ncbi:anti-sigma factor [Agromyces soli]|uniref:Regulator of SigK n=1 Tax=Agromyces soli TaxID=659012 RepID=A0ABY4AY28_9MICO|nr:anti-sigma factor [Agromyces soli]UOE27016.1 anti-sigma factor [Agromyces soli]